MWRFRREHAIFNPNRPLGSLFCVFTGRAFLLAIGKNSKKQSAVGAVTWYVVNHVF